MVETNQTSVTDKNLDRLAALLNREIERSDLAERIPDGAHIFYGSYNDSALTQSNLKLVSKILLGMTLGYVDEAPLVMVYEYKASQQTVVDLSTAAQKGQVQKFIESFQEQSRQNLTVRLDALLAA